MKTINTKPAFPIEKFPSCAVALRPVRFVTNGEGHEDLRYYEGVRFLTDAPDLSCHMYFRRCYVFGGVAKGEHDAAGICDVLNENGDIVSDFWLTKKGLKYLYQALGTRVDRGRYDNQ